MNRATTIDEAQIYGTFAPQIRWYGLKHLGSAGAADDLVQDVSVILLEALRCGRIREPEHLGSFVLGTCRNVVQNRRATGARRGDLLARFPGELIPATDAQRPEPDPARLGFCLTRLGPREYRVIYATFYGECSTDAIAADLSTSAGNVRVIRHRALTHLKRCVEGEGPT